MSSDLYAAQRDTAPSAALAEPLRQLEPPRSAGSLAGTRSGLATVVCYACADLASIALTLAAVRGLLAVTGLAPTFTQFDIRLAVGFAAITLIALWYQGLYSTIPLRPATELRQ